jgi:hypothetical protein
MENMLKILATMSCLNQQEILGRIYILENLGCVMNRCKQKLKCSPEATFSASFDKNINDKKNRKLGIWN